MNILKTVFIFVKRKSVNLFAVPHPCGIFLFFFLRPYVGGSCGWVWGGAPGPRPTLLYPGLGLAKVYPPSGWSIPSTTIPALPCMLYPGYTRAKPALYLYLYPALLYPPTMVKPQPLKPFYNTSTYIQSNPQSKNCIMNLCFSKVRHELHQRKL